jgi:hypothetical protein
MTTAKQLAHQAVKKALRNEKLKPPKKCEECKAPVPLQAHHEDYSKPLEVTWLCTGCHVNRHQELGDRPRRKKGSKVSRRQQPFSMRVSKEALAAYEQAAANAGMSMSEWARHVLDVSSGVSRIRHVYYIDVESMEPEDALHEVTDVAKKVRTGKW